MKQKLTIIVVFIFMGIIMSNAFICINKANFETLTEFIETEDAENGDSYKFKTDPIFYNYGDILRENLLKNNAGLYIHHRERMYTNENAKPETPPPDALVT